MSEMIVVGHQRQIADVTRDIRIKTGQFLLDAIEIGRLLLEAKSMVEPGGWMQYVEDELPFSHSWANNYMRLYKEYGGEQLSIFGNSQATAKLSPTQALELLALPAQEREEFMETHDVEHMSTRAVKNAVQEELEKVKARNSELEQELTQKKDAAQTAEERAKDLAGQLKRVQSEKTHAEHEEKTAKKKVEDLQKKLSEAEFREKEAKADLERARENPEIPESMMEQMRAEVAADAAAKATEEAQKKLAEAEAAAKNAAAARQAAEDRLGELEKQLQVADPNMVRLGVHLEAAQEAFIKLLEGLQEIKEDAPDKAEKLKENIISKLLEPMIEQVREV